jgi:hypothetical protein
MRCSLTPLRNVLTYYKVLPALNEEVLSPQCRRYVKTYVIDVDASHTSEEDPYSPSCPNGLISSPSSSLMFTTFKHAVFPNTVEEFVSHYKVFPTLDDEYVPTSQ